MNRPVCDCEHEKRDHALPSVGSYGYGACKVCLCARYDRKAVVSAPAKSPVLPLERS